MGYFIQISNDSGRPVFQAARPLPQITRKRVLSKNLTEIHEGGEGGEGAQISPK